MPKDEQTTKQVGQDDNVAPPRSSYPECQVTYNPNAMTYTDAEGIKHTIHMPAGTYHIANQHYINKEWDELAKFPRWENQPYTEDFNLNNKDSIAAKAQAEWEASLDDNEESTEEKKKEEASESK